LNCQPINMKKGVGKGICGLEDEESEAEDEREEE
jgi:hypothetical protein